MDNLEKLKLGSESMDSFFSQFQPYDAHTEIVLNIIFEMLLKGNNESLSLSSETGQKGHEVDEHVFRTTSTCDKSE